MEDLPRHELSYPLSDGKIIVLPSKQRGLLLITIQTKDCTLSACVSEDVAVLRIFEWLKRNDSALNIAKQIVRQNGYDIRRRPEGCLGQIVDAFFG